MSFFAEMEMQQHSLKLRAQDNSTCAANISMSLERKESEFKPLTEMESRGQNEQRQQSSQGQPLNEQTVHRQPLGARIPRKQTAHPYPGDDQRRRKQPEHAHFTQHIHALVHRGNTNQSDRQRSGQAQSQQNF